MPKMQFQMERDIEGANAVSEVWSSLCQVDQLRRNEKGEF